MIAKGSRHIVFIIFLICIVFSLASFLINQLIWISLTFFAIGLFFVFFFRDPERKIGKGIVSAADGVIMSIAMSGKYVVIKTFMNVHNVHVNRAPMSGIVKSIKHYQGSFIPAYEKDSNKNERMETIMNTDIGDVRLVQIAGIIARRIVTYLKNGQKLKKGDRIGIIRLGSRVDVYLPKNRVKVVVRAGDRIKAGETTIAFVKKI